MHLTAAWFAGTILLPDALAAVFRESSSIKPEQHSNPAMNFSSKHSEGKETNSHARN